MNDRYYSRLNLLCCALFFLIGGSATVAQAQDKIKIAYSSTDTLNQIWTIAQEAGFYKKHGLDVDLVYIGSTTIGVAAIVAQDIQVGNAAGSGVANAAVRGADTVSVACVINVLKASRLPRI
jgi:ABC-type nitrate/sulfonate/bicarbonate transport system substrate-binding protein